MDKFEQLVSGSQYAVAILGNPSLDSFELLDLAAVPANVAANLTQRNMGFLGVIAIVHGVPRLALVAPLDHETTSALSRAFAQRVDAAFNGVAWLTELYSLPDMRES